MNEILLTLKAPSEGLWSLLFHAPKDLIGFFKRKPQADSWNDLLQDPSVEDDLNQLFDDVKAISQPLMYVSTAKDLRNVLRQQLPTYLLWKGKLWNVILNKFLSKLTSTQFLEAYEEITEEANQFVQEEAQNFINSEDAERLNFATEGIILYSENLLQTLLEQEHDALNLDMLKATLESFVMSDLLILTAALFLVGEFKGEKASLSLIAQQAETFVDQIDDELMSHDPELQKRLNEPVETTISLDECREQLGLG